MEEQSTAEAKTAEENDEDGGCEVWLNVLT
jgi:hypothetical protein